MPFIEVHPAPGLGEMLPGWFVVPNNPFAKPEPVAMGNGVGMMLPMMASQRSRNVLLDIAQTVGRAPGERGSGPVVIHGLGAVSTEDLNPSNWSWQTWLVILGVGVLALSMSRKKRLAYKAAKHSAKAQYYAALAAAKEKHPFLPVAAYQTIAKQS